jgi:DNA-binding CsgD family transcriptional regulator
VKPPSILERLARDLRSGESNVINLMAREGRVQDLAACVRLHQSVGLPRNETCWRVLPELWSALLRDGKIQLFLVENCSGPTSSRIVSFSATIFISDEFCCEARATLAPYLGLQLARHYLSRDLPVLSYKQVAGANAGSGLNVLMCFEGSDYDGLSREQILAAREKQKEAFHLAHAGYHVKELLAEPIGDMACQWMLEAGARIRRDYSGYFRRHRLPMPDPSQRPRLVGLTEEEAFDKCGCQICSLFAHSSPRFHFNRSEQELLRHALLGETCEELARSLFISPWTVKKRWHAIYERVADVDSELLPLPIADGPHATSRGAERRRHLLYYLRQHPEELRPDEWARWATTSIVLLAIEFIAGGELFDGLAVYLS